MKFRIEGCVMTNPGRVRSNNEDNYNLFGVYREDVNDYIRTVEMTAPEGYCLAAVLDGMGGESAGEVASYVAAQSVAACPLSQVKTTGLEQLLEANQKVCDETVRRGGKRMGTTFVGAYIENGQFEVANVGDSRCYLLRGGVLSLLSKDHSMGQRMIDSGVMTEAEARGSKSWHELTQHFGIFPEEFTIEPYYTDVFDLMDGDELLLCSDGLTDMMVDAEINAIIANPAPIKDKVEALVNAALEKGGRDNVTVMIVRAIALGSDETTLPYGTPNSDKIEAESTVVPFSFGDEDATQAIVQPIAVNEIQPADSQTVQMYAADTIDAEPTAALPIENPAPPFLSEPVAAGLDGAGMPVGNPVAVNSGNQEYTSADNKQENKLRKTVNILTIIMIILIVIFVGLAGVLVYLLLFS